MRKDICFCIKSIDSYLSKLVLSSVIPIINYELTRLLDEVCDFEIELEMNDKNEVDFNIKSAQYGDNGAM